MEHQINGPLNVRQLIIPAKHPNYHQHLICGTAGFSDSLKINGGRKTSPRHSSSMALPSKLYVDFIVILFEGGDCDGNGQKGSVVRIPPTSNVS